MFVIKNKAIVLATLAIIIALAVLLISSAIARDSERSINTIQEYEKETLSVLTTTNTLSNLDERDRYLDQIENYLMDNKKTLQIKNINRLEDSIIVEFFYGNKYMVYPTVQNMK
jgi:bifunctional pyridoxal-dependent enzyme with beta-cystathionase and maltose regulon repressor activities